MDTGVKEPDAAFCECGSGKTYITFGVIKFCEECAHHHEMVWIDNREEFYPLMDTFVCGCCSESYHDDDGVMSADDGFVCDSCAAEYYVQTCESSRYYHRDCVYYWERDEEWHTEPEPEGGLLPYSTNVLDVLGRRTIGNASFSHYDKTLLLGAEVEMDARNDDPDYMADKILESGFSENGICKSDGTVSGPEMVTLPGTLAEHKAADWKGWLAVARDHGGKGHFADSAGMHIHINKRALSPLTLGKFMVFINSPDNSRFVSFIAQRNVEACHWARFQEKKVTDALLDRNDMGGKYQAVNVTKNTVELRIFRSNLQPERVYKNLEFADAAVKFCRQASVKELSAVYFVQWISKQRKEYPNLTQYMTTAPGYDTGAEWQALRSAFRTNTAKNPNKEILDNVSNN